MLIHYQKGDIFDSTSQVIVNTVNCRGVMGKGLALTFKERYPAMFPVYQQECKSGKLRIGRPTLYKESTPWILNFPTKIHWRLPSKMEYIEKGLAYFIAHYKEVGIKSIAFPKLGVQNGKLSWDDVGPVMAKYLSQLDIDVCIYVAEGDREYQYDAQRESDIEQKIWQQFSKLASSQERLIQEVFLSPREAKKVVNKREQMELTSLADIESVEGLAKVSLERIKNYVRSQRYTIIELIEMPEASVIHHQHVKKSKKPANKKRNKHPANHENATEESLFTSELVS